MDTNWCLFCGHHIDNELPYCSLECQAKDDPIFFPLYTDDTCSDSTSQIIPILLVPHHDEPTSRYTGRDNDGISAWASQIPPSSPPISPPPIEDSVPLPPLASSSSVNASSSARRPPKLLLHQTRALPPSLCMSTPKPSPLHPSVPIQAPAQSICNLVREHPATFGGSESMTSLVTESVATPVSGVAPPMEPSNRKPSTPASFLAQLATQVRSWVGSSTSHSHPKSQTMSPQPAIVGIDDQALTFPSKGHDYFPEDEMAGFVPPVAKLKWSLAAEPETDLSDYDSEDDDGSYSLALDLKSSPTPTPHPATCRGPNESSASVLDILVEEFHPAFRSRGRRMVRYAS